MSFNYSFLGCFIVCCVEVGVVGDDLFWCYMINGVSESDFLEYWFEKKLYCYVYEFGDCDENFVC